MFYVMCIFNYKHTVALVVHAINRYSEKSRMKCIGITIETRPDYCLKKHLRLAIMIIMMMRCKMYHVTLSSSNMLNYGCTRLEIGVQSVYEDVARDTNR